MAEIHPRQLRTFCLCLACSLSFISCFAIERENGSVFENCYLNLLYVYDLMSLIFSLFAATKKIYKVICASRRGKTTMSEVASLLTQK